MVAIKPAHIKLTIRDLLPGALWEWEDVNRKKDEIQEELEAAGITDPNKLHFAVASEFEKYLNSFPTYSERQKIMKRIYPVVKSYSFKFTQEELEYLREKLHGVNDPVGQQILQKIAG